MANLLFLGAAGATPTASATLATAGMHHNRQVPGAESGEGGQTSSLNLIFIVGLALFISVLARHLSTRGGRKK